GQVAGVTDRAGAGRAVDRAGVADRAGVDVGQGDQVGRRAGDVVGRGEAPPEAAVDVAQAAVRVADGEARDGHVAGVGDEVAVGDRVAAVGRGRRVRGLDDADRRRLGQ